MTPRLMRLIARLTPAQRARYESETRGVKMSDKECVALAERLMYEDAKREA